LLGLRPPALGPGALVRAGEVFDIAEGTTRVALSRMVAAGELVADNGTYKLAGRLLDRMARQDASRRPVLKRWNGEWLTAVVTKTGRTASQRAELRTALRELRLAELREGVWMRPDNLTGSSDDPSHVRAIVDEQCLWLRSSTEDPREIAAALWHLDAWSERAEHLRLRMQASTLQLRGTNDNRRTALRDGFVLAASVLRHMQADPLLPDELLPSSWPGRALRSEYDGYARVFARRWGEWLGVRTLQRGTRPA
jgi:phenylacetic acid degradation operon negative regulatory protein